MESYGGQTQERLRKLLAPLWTHRRIEYLAENLRQASAAEIRHAHCTQSCPGILMDGVDGHNVGVLELGKRLRLASLRRRNLQHHRTVGEVGLAGKIDACEGAFAQFALETKVKDFVADVRQSQRGRAAGASRGRANNGVLPNEVRERVFVLRKAVFQLRQTRLFTLLTALVEFLEHQAGNVGIATRIGRPTWQKLFGPDRLHMNREGYRLWASILGPYLADAEAPASRPS